jgi:uroporphyrinogen decarboxylase
MNSRERVKKVIRHEIPDRIPIDFGGTPATSISPVAYHNLRKELRLEDKPFYIPNFIFQSVYPEDEILEKFSVDIIDCGRAFIKSINWKKWQLNDEIVCLIPEYINIDYDKEGNAYVKNNEGFVVAKKRKGSIYFDQSTFPYIDMSSMPESFDDSDLKKTITNYWNIAIVPLHLDLYKKDQYDLFINTLKDLSEKTDKAISLLVGCPIFAEGGSLRGVENFYCDLYQDKKGVERLLDRLLNGYMGLLDKILTGAGKYIDIIRFADDLGFQEGPIIPPEKYKEFFMPRHKKMWDFIHNNSDCAVSLHSCGSIFKIIPHLINAGLDILNPVQTSARDMEPEKLKKEFGKDIVFWGGCADTQNLLIFGDTGQVRKDTRDRMEKLGRDGGLIFASINAIQHDIDPKNVIALFEAAKEYGAY